ncbi:metallophosphoesterase [Pseudonocardia spinosispora]|uniref:metallophosphoesterase n=1 Tax=Pseudonocardia spinosispora TaxID=103441 RepID=UPI0012EC543C|nr:metallophosphoesterase [Pseudonocardia spinosispora]
MTEGPRHTLIQITDSHIRAEDTTGAGQVDTFALLGSALRVVEALAPRPTAVLFTGDLADDGDPLAYSRLRDLVGPVLARIGVPAVYLPGNHDVRGVMREHLLDQAPDDAPLDSVSWFGDVRVVALDSTVPGFAYGLLEPAQLEWLRSELATPAPAGTVVALHHPPLPSFAPFTSSIELQNRADLAAAIAGTDVRAVLAGHTHMVGGGVVAGVPVWTGGPLATIQDPVLPGGALRGLAAPGLTRLDLYTNTAVATHVPIDVDVVWQVPPEKLAPTVEKFRSQLPS